MGPGKLVLALYNISQRQSPTVWVSSRVLSSVVHFDVSLAEDDPMASEEMNRNVLRRYLPGKIAFLIVGFGSLIMLGKWTGIDVWKQSPKGFALFIVSAAAAVIADRVVTRLLAGSSG